MLKNRLDSHIDFMRIFISDINTLVAHRLKYIRQQYQVSLEQSQVLALLANGKAMTLTEITEKQGVNKAAVSRRVKKLVELKLVKWAPVNENHDQRLKYIVIAAKGRRFLDENNMEIRDLVGEMLDDLSNEEIETARSVLETVDQRLKEQLP